MKHKLLKHLLASALLLCAGNSWALDQDASGVYQLGKAQDLADFAALVNAGSTTIAGAMTADIDMADWVSANTWTSIGDWNTGAVTSAFCGTFDGQGHSIKNFNITVTANYRGLFGVVSAGADIKNFSIYGDVTVTGGKSIGIVGYTRDTSVKISNIQSYLNFTSSIDNSQIGGIVGSANSGTTYVDRCAYHGKMSVTDNGSSGNYSGIVGYLNNTTNALCYISNTIFDGTVENLGTGNCTFGGFIGYSKGGIYNIQNCLSIGTITANVYGMFFGAVKANYTFTNNYYMGTTAYGSSSTVAVAATSVTSDQIASGEVAYRLNGDQSTINFYQTLPSDTKPTLDATHSQVYAAGELNCKGEPKDGTTFSNTVSTATCDDHNFVDGLCSVCGMPKLTNGYFELCSANSLKWFANYVNTANNLACAKLTADIDMNKEQIPVIGCSSTASYKGTFDGQGHKISNFQLDVTGTLVKSTGYGLFGNTYAATIKNFSVDGAISCSLTSPGDLGIGTIGWPDGKTLIQDVYSAIDVNALVATHCGGLVGSLRTATVNRCEYAGTLSAGAFANGHGGITGYSNAGTITNTIFSGKVVSTNGSAFTGGILAYVNSASVTVKNCLSIGTLEVASGTTCAGMLVAQCKNIGTYENNYYTSGETAVGSKNLGSGIADKVTNNSFAATEAQLKSGEIAYKLGAEYYQTIGTDNAPVLSATSKKVYQLTIGSAGYATFVTPVAVSTFPTGVTANAGQAASTYVHLEPVAAAPANTALVLKASEGSYYYNGTDEEVSLGTTNDLKAAAEAVTADGTQYILAKSDDVVGFYQATTGTTIAAGKAYIESTSGVKGFVFEDENATAINSVNADASVNGAIYNLAGQRVNKAQKGIFIQKGKKYLF